MSDATDTQHHLEEGLLLFTRGMAFEAREAWRRVLQSDPSNPVALDYIQSTECELNPYDRQREAEAARQRPAPRVKNGGWEDDELEVIAAGPADDDEERADRGRPGVTGFTMADDDLGGDDEEVTPAVGVAGGRWAADAVPGDWDGRAEEAVEAGDGEDEEESVPPPSRTKAAAGAPAGAGPLSATPGRGEGGEVWEPLAWMDEDTPTVPVGNGVQSPVGRGGAMAAAGGRSSAVGGSSLGRPAGSGAGERASGPAGAQGSFNGQAVFIAAEEPSEEEVRAAQLEQSERLLAELLSSDEAEDEAQAAAPAKVELDVVTLMSQAALALQEGRQEQARTLLLKVLERDSSHVTAKKFLKRIEKQLLARYQRILGSEEGVPILNPLGDLMNLNLDEIGGYVLSRIDGFLTLDDIYTLSANIDRLTVMRILTELIEGGIISIRR